MSNPPFPAQPLLDEGKAMPVVLQGPAGAIEAAIEGHDPDVPRRALVAVICHPLPTEGGTMHNKVVTMTARALQQCGATTVRFNFRGVGGSEGSWDDGNGEADDVRAVVAWVREQRPEAELWLAGFSFGSGMAYKVSADVRPDALIMIAPPVGRSTYGFEKLVPFDGPWLVIQGEADEIVDPQKVYDWVESLPQRPELVRIPDSSHFFHRKLVDLRGAVKNGVRPWLPPEADGSDA